jgi:hypothetical protein
MPRPGAPGARPAARRHGPGGGAAAPRQRPLPDRRRPDEGRGRPADASRAGVLRARRALRVRVVAWAVDAAGNDRETARRLALRLPRC